MREIGEEEGWDGKGDGGNGIKKVGMRITAGWKGKGGQEIEGSRQRKWWRKRGKGNKWKWKREAEERKRHEG